MATKKIVVKERPSFDLYLVTGKQRKMVGTAGTKKAARQRKKELEIEYGLKKNQKQLPPEK